MFKIISEWNWMLSAEFIMIKFLSFDGIVEINARMLQFLYARLFEIFVEFK